jgi:integrase
MQRLPNEQRLATKLSFLGPTSRDQLLRYMLALSARHYAPTTVEATITVVRRFLRDQPAPRREALSADLSSAKPQDITAFVSTAQLAGLAPSTVNLSLSVLSEFFDFLRDEGLMQAQPVIRRQHRLLAPATLPKPMPEHDLVQFFKAVDSQRDRLLFLVMLRCGLRVSEACSLRWDDYDVEAGSMRVNDGKGHVDRVVYVSPDLERELKAWRAKVAGSPYLFPSRKRKGRPLDRRVVNVCMGDYLQRAGITKR